MNHTKSFVFIIGSPRSGTTLLGEILSLHPDIAQWYEPYFIWRRFFRNAPDDEKKASNATPKIKQYIHECFVEYQKKTKQSIIIDKSPGNSLTIPFILEIFPNAHFIHLVRDGRDTTLSINKEWKKRQEILSGGNNSHHFNLSKASKVIRQWLHRQPFLKDKLKALWFETHGHLLDSSKHFNRLRWHGNVGWGPRHAGWSDDLKNYSRLEFNALQWTNCVNAVRKNWDRIPEKNRIEIRYENLISKTQDTVAKVAHSLNVELTPDFSRRFPQIKENNCNKWRREFTQSEIELIKPILSPVLGDAGYLSESPW